MASSIFVIALNKETISADKATKMKCKRKNAMGKNFRTGETRVDQNATTRDEN